MDRGVADRMARIEIPFSGRTVNSYLLWDGARALLVDTGVEGAIASHLSPALNGLGLGFDSLELAVITHADYDHMGGNAELARRAPGCELACHAADLACVADIEQMIKLRYDQFAERDGMPLGAAGAEMVRDSAGAAPVARSIAAGDLRFGRCQVEVVELPGHSAGHIGLFDPVSGDLIAGDAVMGSGLPGADGFTPTLPPSYRDLKAYLATIGRIRRLAPERLLTGHFAPLSGTEVADFLDRSVAFVGEFGRLVESELRAGGTLGTADLCAAVAARSRWWPEDPGAFGVAFPVCAHLEAMAADGLVALQLVDGRRRWRLAD